ncbi:FAD-dependent oxidoreductase [uncultured Roseovarius sp.]|uniref:FAD-dependent oxidoreductase n=1 Tax=uncultured Roseovarius sp. TaxID=293344 RepID=UPI0025DD0D9B|nr:FAD-dependent oxidoreductase [uncultured Roseovarius sp.]
MVDVTIIGAGVAGLCIARELRDRGTHVQLYDRGGAPGTHSCSWWAGGMLAPYCEAESAEPEVVNLGEGAAQWWQDKTGLVNSQGSLVVSQDRDQGQLCQFARRTSQFDHVDRAQIAELEPDLGDRFSSGLFFSSESHICPRSALTALHQSLLRDGVEFIVAERDPTDSSKAGLTIDCRGYSARDELTNLRGVKGEMLMLSCPDVTLSRTVRLLHPRIPLYVVPRGNGIYMVGATMIESSASDHVTARSLLEMLSAAYALNPAFGEAELLEIGTDARPAFADNLPRIRRRGGMIYVNGLFRHGFLLSPALARMTADLVMDGQIPEVMDEDHS